MKLMLYNYGVTSSLEEAEKVLIYALRAKNKRQMTRLVAEALGIVRTINDMVIEVEDNTEECE